MKMRSIKFRITCWYTGIMMVVFGLILLAAGWYFGHYSVGVIEEELRDEVQDLKESILRFPEDFPPENTAFYFDDGAMLSLYDEDERFINGIFPEDFPQDYSLEEGKIRTIKLRNDNWMVCDAKLKLPDDRTVWVRGIYSCSPLAAGNMRMIRIMVLLFVLLVLFTAFIGYRMLRQALRPVQEITKTANEITSSMTLSGRIPVPKNKDEIYELCRTFNQMLESLEANFLRERQFSSDAAHELRTPVSVILSQCEYCLEELELSDEAKGEIRVIRRKARQMSELVSRLLAISRSERQKNKLEKEEVDLLLLAETVSEELQEKAEAKGIRIEVDNQMENTVILADMSMLTRLFINLTENAVTYGRRQGCVWIRLGEQEGRVRIRFEDNGIGISPEDQERIWDRFYRVDASHTSGENFGLGLFMVKQIVDWHKGEVTVESIPGKGSRFTVVLPRILPGNPEN